MVRDLPDPVHFLFLRRWVSTCRQMKAHTPNEPVCLTRITLRLCLTSPAKLLEDVMVVLPLTYTITPPAYYNSVASSIRSSLAFQSTSNISS